MLRVGLCCNFIANRFVYRMASRSTYEDAVHKLNTLQSNKSTIEQIRRDIKTGQKCTNLEDMENYLLRSGVTLSTLDELSVIHIAGTKGKGSTSAMCESILRHHGYRTGFYSSPHLVAVRERIRIDGHVISEEYFAKYFHELYDRLHITKEHEGDIPKYFAFLTVLAYNIFVKEKVDVAIIEVGIGGIVDYTNVIRKVAVVGITSLGLDHTSILGTSLPEIAAAKAGIMKPGCEAYTVSQPVEAMEVLKSVANSVKCPLYIVPNFSTYKFPEEKKSFLPVELDAYRMNASLAIQLSHAWMRLQGSPTIIEKYTLFQPMIKRTIKEKDIEDTPFLRSRNLSNCCIEKVPRNTVLGLSECKWPGRYQVINLDYANFYLDGAHTKESMEICVQWFENSNRDQESILVFSATGDRDAQVLLKPLRNVNFKKVYFVIPTAYKNINENNDNFSLIERQELIKKCKNHGLIWENLGGDFLSSEWSLYECVSDALIAIKKQYVFTKPSVLITGSLHLVGASLSILDPNLSNS